MCTSFFHRRAWHEAGRGIRHNVRLGMRATPEPTPETKQSGTRRIDCHTKQYNIDCREYAHQVDSMASLQCLDLT
jgi:hypothetical protein